MNRRSIQAGLRRLLGSLRSLRRLALKAFEMYLPGWLGYALSKLADPSFRLSALAATYAERLPLDPDLVMYESYNGRDFAGNAYALFLHLAGNVEYTRLRYAIVVPRRSRGKVRAFRRDPRVRIVRTDTRAYVRLAETCGTFINDASWKPYLVKREGQAWVYTWHSTLLKKLALDKGAPWEARNVSRALVCADFFISPNRFTTELLIKSHGVSGFVGGRIAEFGYPRNDLTIAADAALVRSRLGVGAGEKLVLFAPTWRGEQHAVDNVAEILAQRERLESLLPPGHRVLVKFHTMVYRFLDRAALRVSAPMELDANELLASADVLVTDYSGIFFDFLLVDRPIVFYVPDREAYAKAKNGFYLELDDLPGPIGAELEIVASDIARAGELEGKYAPLRAAFRRRFAADDDGKACARTADLVFKGIEDGRVYRIEEDRKRILLYPGPLNPNGVTTSFLSMLRVIDPKRYAIAVLLPDDERNRIFQSMIDPRAGVFYLGAPDPFTFREYLSHARAMRLRQRGGEEPPRAAYERSLRRIFGGLAFDLVVNYHGYQPADAARLALGARAERKTIFLHNDLERDRRIKQPQLGAVFSLYRHYDKLFCVSEDSLESNLAGMAAYVRKNFSYDVAGRMDFVNNLIEPERIRALAREALPAGTPAPSGDGVRFLTIGRLSPEKKQLRLIEAFAETARSIGVDARAKGAPGAGLPFLTILGSGKMAGALKRRARKLGLGERIAFIPFLANPYPLIAACDCFVLSSDIEGQPITLLESLTLGKPIIATDIPGPRYLLRGGEGLLVPPNAADLARAMADFIRSKGRMERKLFDAEAYVEAAKNGFIAKVLEGKA